MEDHQNTLFSSFDGVESNLFYQFLELKFPNGKDHFPSFRAYVVGSIGLGRAAFYCFPVLNYVSLRHHPFSVKCDATVQASALFSGLDGVE